MLDSRLAFAQGPPSSEKSSIDVAARRRLHGRQVELGPEDLLDAPEVRRVSIGVGVHVSARCADAVARIYDVLADDIAAVAGHLAGVFMLSCSVMWSRAHILQYTQGRRPAARRSCCSLSRTTPPRMPVFYPTSDSVLVPGTRRTRPRDLSVAQRRIAGSKTTPPEAPICTCSLQNTAP